MQKTIQVRGILPPGIEKNSSIVFGIMWLRVGRLTLADRASNSTRHRILIQFWGEKQPIYLQPENTPSPDLNRMHEYEIRCPVLNFQKYLLDMKNNLKIEVEEEGNVSIDFKSLLVKNANHTSKSAFDHFKSSFPVIRKGKKVGTLDIEMASNFNPKILEAEVEQNGLEYRNAIDLLAVNKPQLLQEFLDDYDKEKQRPFESIITDNRIPNSLNLQQPEQEKFDPYNYRDKQELPGALEQPVPKRHKPKIDQASHGVQTPLKQSQFKSPVSQQGKQFPALEKILTYSNLKLHDEEQAEQRNNDEDMKHIRLEQSLKQRVQGDDQIRRNQQLRREFYGADTPRSHFIADIIESVPKSEEEKPRMIAITPAHVGLPQSSSRNQEQLPKVIQMDPTSTKKLDNFEIPRLNEPHVNRSEPPADRILLTLYVQIRNIRLTTPINFHLWYKPYGQSERTRIEYKHTNAITIISTVGVHELKIMDRVPFIVEVWDSRKNAFIGVAKVDLNKIKQGFLIGNAYINEKAVKANVLPTTIFKGNVDVQNLKKAVVGESWMIVMIGTSSQVNTYINDSKDSQINANSATKPVNNNTIQLQPQAKQPVEVELRNSNTVNTLELFTEFMEYLRSSHTKITPELLRIISLKELNQEAFASFLSRINKISFLPLYTLLNYKTRGCFPVQLISDSFDEYNSTYSKLQLECDTRLKLLRAILNEDILSVVQTNSQFNLISKEKFIRIVSEYTQKSSNDIRLLLRFNPEEFLSTSKLRLQLVNRGSNVPFQLTNKLLQQEALRQIKQIIRCNSIQPSDIVGYFRQTDRLIHVDDLSRIFKSFGCSVSFWRLLLFIERVKQLISDDTRNPLEITYASFYNWFSDVRKQINEGNDETVRLEQLKKELQPQSKPANLTPLEGPKPKLSQPANLRHTATEQSVHSQDIQDEIPNLGLLVNEIMQNRHDQFKEQEPPKEIGSPHSQQHSPSPVRPSELADTVRRWKHSFTVEPVELTLEQPIHGSCNVSYRFPHEDQQIQSKLIHTFQDKYKYEVKMLGKHVIILEDQLTNYFADEVIMFRVIVDGIEVCEAAIPVQEYLIDLGSQTKILALFATSSEQEDPNIAGKLRIKLSYSKQLSHQDFIGKETTMSMFLPKSGNLNVDITSAVDMKKLAQELKIKEEFYCSLQFELFPNSKQLQHVIKPLVSKLHATLSETLCLRDSIRLKLTPAIIQYLKSKNCRITLNAVYYQRIQGMPKKQQLIMGIIEIPLLSIVAGRGIKGDYAFKNKYGIFVALAQCNINYGKGKIQPTSQQTNHDQLVHSKQMANEKIWVIMSFLEVLSYGEDLKNVGFQIFYKREKHSTGRCPIRSHDIITPLKGCSMLLAFTQQELFQQTFISVNIKTNNKEKLFVDISTRALLDSLQRTRHTIFGGYFTVAAQHNEIKPIRIGLKIYGFRGSSKVKDLVNAIHQNLEVDIFQKLDIPAELDNYPKMVELYRNALKIPKTHFEEYLGDLLSNRQRLNIELFTTRINFRLDLSQFKAKSHEDIIRLMQACSQMEEPIQTVNDILESEEVQLINYKPDFLSRFTFKELDYHHLDRNAELFELGSLVDVLTFVRKVEVLGEKQHRKQNEGDLHNSAEENSQVESGSLFILRVGIEKGKNIESLYNGIKPNSLVRCPTLELETEVAERESNPQYNLQTELRLEAHQLADFKKLDFEIYHRLSIEGEGSEEILIGHGRVDISSVLFFKGDRKSSVFTILMTPEKSLMKNTKAQLKVVCEIERIVEEQPSRYDRTKLRDSFEPSGMQNSNQYDMSRIARILKEDVRIGREMLFESSDEDDR